MCATAINLTMRDIKTVMQNFVVNFFDFSIEKKRKTVYLVNTIYEFAKFKCYMFLTQTFERYFIKEYPDRLEVSYFFIGSQYKFIVRKKKGGINSRNKISKIIDVSTNTNITTMLSKELGPYKDFHNNSITPRLLGYPEGLEISFKDKTTISYKGDEYIS